MLATLQMIRDTYQGAEGYLKQKCGFSDEDIQIIRTNILERPSELTAFASVSHPDAD